MFTTLVIFVLLVGAGVWAYRHFRAIELQSAVAAARLASAMSDMPQQAKASGTGVGGASSATFGAGTGKQFPSPGTARFNVSRKLLIIASLLADALELMLVGQLPGIGWLIQWPVIALHVAYAGPYGWAMLLELVPVVGTAPMYTIAALMYPEKK